MQLNSLLETLNLSNKDGLYFYGDLSKKKTDFLSIRVKETFLEHLKPDAFFCINNEPLILFFEKKRDLETLERQIWNFNQSPTIFIHDDSQWLIKNGFKFLESTKRLDTLTSNKNIKDFEYFELITGHSWEKYKKEFEQKNRVDFYLLKNIEEVRDVLINPKLGNLHPKVANSLIGRVIFIRYLIDREVELGEKYEINGKEDFYNILLNKQKTYTFFQKIKANFNGNLFPLEYEINEQLIKEDDKVNDYHLSIIINLLKGDKINKDSSVQSSFFDIYDFSIIPIEFVSNVYEKFIGIDKQADSGAYYTPLFLVDYIQKETVSKYFLDNPNEYNCKVLDPACGSGVFLVETLRQIISQYTKQHPVNIDDETEYNLYKDKLKSLLQDNVFGIDKDEKAISVAIFSLYITLLDNLKPKSIVGFQFPELIGSNFFSNDFFDREKDFNIVLKNHHFQFILGNPPWKTKGHPKEKQLFEKYVENRKKQENSNLEIENREIAEAFLIRVSDFNFYESALVVTSKILYKLGRKKNKKGIFRNYYLNNFKVRKVLELSSVRLQVFGANSKKKGQDKGTAPSTVLFYKKSKPLENKDNIIKHISLKPNIFFDTFKLMVIEKYDIKKVAQKIFIDEDWIWKVLVYGNILDYHFMKRLKKNKSIYDYISDKKNFVFGKGISVGGGDKNSIEEHKKIIHSINSKKKALMPFYISYSENFLKKIEYVHRPRKIELFKSPVLLVGKGISNEFKAKSAISFKDVIYTDAITGIKPLNSEGNKIILMLEALFNSNLFSYFLVNTTSSIGIEREQSHDKDDKFSTPLIINFDEKLVEIVKKQRELKNWKNNFDFNDVENINNNIEIESKQTLLDEELLKIYDLSQQERDLIDYTNTITIPLLKGKDEEKKKIVARIKNKDGVLKNYAQIFIDHFSKRFNADGNYFEVEILWSEYTILMKFKIIPEPSKEKDLIKWSKLDNKELIINLTKLGFENLSDNLFLQKDIKGFEEDYFYIAKPNQYKSWHSALAHLDLSEFIHELHKNIKV